MIGAGGIGQCPQRAGSGRSSSSMCVETSRSRPGREMVLRLTERLDVPLRERDGLLMAVGFAPVHRERSIDAPRCGPRGRC